MTSAVSSFRGVPLVCEDQYGYPPFRFGKLDNFETPQPSPARILNKNAEVAYCTIALDIFLLYKQHSVMPRQYHTLS